MWPLRAMVVVPALLLILIAGGCSRTGPTNVTPEPSIGTIALGGALDRIVLPLDRYRLIPENMPATRRAELLLTNRCLRRFGLSVPDTLGDMPASGSLNSRRYGLNDAGVAKIYGYHVNPTGKAVNDTVPPVVSSVITGDGIGDINGVKVPDGGCIGEARRILAGAVSPPGNPYLGNELAHRSWTMARSDSRVRRAVTEWSDCIDASGYRYPDPFGASDDPAFLTSAPTPREISVAVADVRCKDQTGLVRLWFAVETAYQIRLIAGNQIALDELYTWMRAQEVAAASMITAEKQARH